MWKQVLAKIQTKHFTHTQRAGCLHHHLNHTPLLKINWNWWKVGYNNMKEWKSIKKEMCEFVRTHTQAFCLCIKIYALPLRIRTQRLTHSYSFLTRYRKWHNLLVTVTFPLDYRVIPIKWASYVSITLLFYAVQYVCVCVH